MKVDLTLLKNVLTPLVKSVLIPVTNGSIQKNIQWIKDTLIIWNKKLDDIMKIVKSLDESVLLIKGVRETIANEAKWQKGGFMSNKSLWIQINRNSFDCVVCG